MWRYDALKLLQRKCQRGRSKYVIVGWVWLWYKELVFLRRSWQTWSAVGTLYLPLDQRRVNLKVKFHIIPDQVQCLNRVCVCSGIFCWHRVCWAREESQTRTPEGSGRNNITGLYNNIKEEYVKKVTEQSGTEWDQQHQAFRTMPGQEVPQVQDWDCVLKEHPPKSVQTRSRLFFSWYFL